MDKMNGVEIGDNISFQYEGGSTPGRCRFLKVEDIVDDRVRGIDLDTGQPRQFLFDKMGEVTIAPFDLNRVPVELTTTETTTISFMEGRQYLKDHIDTLTGEELAQAIEVCNGGNQDAEYHGGTGMITMECEVLVPHFTNTIDGVNIVNKDGERLAIVIGTDGGVIMEDKSEMVMVTPMEMIEKVSRHLGLTIE
jgi:hypothetical protein